MTHDLTEKKNQEMFRKITNIKNDLVFFFFFFFFFCTLSQMAPWTMWTFIEPEVLVLTPVSAILDEKKLVEENLEV